MTRDFAKTKKKGGQRRPQSRKQASSVGRGWRIYGAGVLSGIFLSFLVYLGSLSSPPRPATEHKPASGTEAAAPKPRFDFYTLLPEQTIDVDVEAPEVEPASDLGSPPPAHPASDHYLLQAGSFRQFDDADRRRAQLLLLGLEPTIEESSGDNGRWFRVYLGPFDSPSDMNRARSLTANQDIDTLLLKRASP